MAARSAVARLRALQEAEKARARAVNDHNYLCTQILGMRVLDGQFSRELSSFLDSNRDELRVLLMAPRFSYKTLSIKGRILQEILRNPAGVTIGYVHHTLEKAKQIVAEVGEQLLKNPQLRALLPDEYRPPTRGKWLREDEFIMPGRMRLGDRQPTLKAFSTGMDMTGQHFSFLVGDDIISKKTVEEQGGVEGISRWWTSTAIPVIGATGRALLIGTRWSYDDLYGDAITSKYWKVMLRGILETDHAPDPLGQPIPLKILTNPDDFESQLRDLTLDDVIRYKAPAPDGMGSDFNAQMLNLPEPEGGRSWLPGTCEHFVKLEDIQDWVRQVVVLSDPSPVGDSSKHDYWAHAVIAYYEEPKTPGVMKRCLIDGAFSQEWDMQTGLMHIVRLLRKWQSLGAAVVGIEEGLGAARNAKVFVNGIRDVARGRVRALPIAFKQTQQANSKGRRFAELVGLAVNGWFTIADSCNPEFRELFLKQARAHPDEYQGHDDLRDCVSYLNDPALDDYIPKASIPVRRRNQVWDPYALTEEPDEGFVGSSRYFGI